MCVVTSFEMTEQYSRGTINEPGAPMIATFSFADSGETLQTRHTYFVDTAGGATTLNLPIAAGGGEIRVKNMGGNPLTLSRTGTDLIDGATTFILAGLFDSATFVSNEDEAWGIW